MLRVYLFFFEARCSWDMRAGPASPLWKCFGATVAVWPSPAPRLCLCTRRASLQHRNKIEARLSCRRCSRKVTRHVSVYSRLACTRNTRKQVAGTWFQGKPIYYIRAAWRIISANNTIHSAFCFRTWPYIYHAASRGAAANTCSAYVPWNYLIIQPAKAMVHDNTTRSQGWCDLSLSGTTST